MPSLHRFLAEAKGRPGTRRLAAVIAPGPAPTRSALEDAFLALLDRTGLPRPIANATIAGVEVDFYWPDRGLVVEVDGLRFHDTPVRRRTDRRKQAALEAGGLRVVRVTPDQVTRHTAQTGERLEAALGRRG